MGNLTIFSFRLYGCQLRHCLMTLCCAARDSYRTHRRSTAGPSNRPNTPRETRFFVSDQSGHLGWMIQRRRVSFFAFEIYHRDPKLVVSYRDTRCWRLAVNSNSFWQKASLSNLISEGYCPNNPTPNYVISARPSKWEYTETFSSGTCLWL